MAIEDHIINTVRTLRSAGESLIDLATKVANEVTKDNKPAEQKNPEGATSKSAANQEVWEKTTIEKLPSNGVFRTMGDTYQLTGGKVALVEYDLTTISVYCAEPLSRSGYHVYFHPLCVVTAPKKG